MGEDRRSQQKQLGDKSDKTNGPISGEEGRRECEGERGGEEGRGTERGREGGGIEKGRREGENVRERGKEREGEGPILILDFQPHLYSAILFYINRN